MAENRYFLVKNAPCQIAPVSSAYPYPPPNRDKPTNPPNLPAPAPQTAPNLSLWNWKGGGTMETTTPAENRAQIPKWLPVMDPDRNRIEIGPETEKA